MNFTKYFQIHICFILFACSIESSISNCIASDEIGVRAFNSIADRDAAIKNESIKTANFNTITQASMFDSNQGDLLKYCSVIWEQDNIKMKMIYNYLQDPVYVPLGLSNHAYQPIDYDKDKRLIVWRFLETYIISTPLKTEKLDILQRIYVSPNGNVEKSSGTYITKHVFHQNSKNDGNGDFTLFLMAAGLSYSDYIDFNSISLLESLEEQIEIRSNGTFGRNLKGTWRLTVDPSSSFFVRKASFTVEGLDKPSMEVSTSNIIEINGLKYSREAKMIFGDSSTREYMNIDIAMGDNQELRQEILRRIESSLPPGSEIIDFNEGKPVRMIIK